MYYEVYVDSIFLVNFVMNFYLLLLTNHSTLRTATCKRLLLGAAVGAVFGLLPFWGSGFKWLKLFISAVAGTLLMVLTAFPVRKVKAIVWIVEKLLLYTFLLGGALLFFIRYVPFVRRMSTGIFGIMGTGAIVCIAVLYHKEREERKRNNSFCQATLIQKRGRMTVTALVDSGNTLIEPISGKPVCIIEQSVFESLFRGGNQLFRAIPYHSIGKSRGILKGYLLSELQLEIGGIKKSFQDVYVAVCQERISDGVKMLVNPMILKKVNNNCEMGNDYDTKSCDTGENAI